MVHTWKQTKETWCGIADILQMSVLELVQIKPGDFLAVQIKRGKVDSFDDDDT